MTSPRLSELLSVVWLRHTVTLCAVIAAAHAFVEVPKLSQLKLLYPGWKHHGGRYNDHDMLTMIGTNDTQGFEHLHNTAALRMSWALNRYGGRHSLGNEPIYLSQVSRDSMTGKDSHEYIYRNTAFGPYLALKYNNPAVIRVARDAKQTMTSFGGRQGIVRFVSYHGDHAGGHIALWDCDHFHQSRDWTTERHIISVEFWESSDSYCPPPPSQPAGEVQHVAPAPQDKVVPRHNFDSQQQRRLYRQERRARHYSARGGKTHETLWVQGQT